MHLCQRSWLLSLFEIATAIRSARMTLVLVFVISLAASVQGQDVPLQAKSFRDRVVDKIVLSDGTQIWGMLVNRRPTQMLVRTTWIKTSCPEFFEKDLRPQIVASASAPYSTLATGIQKEIDTAESAEPRIPQRTGLLREILERLSPEVPDDPNFILLELPKSRVTRLEPQTEARRELCRLAILNDLPDVEDQHWRSVTEKLLTIPEASRRVKAPEATNSEQDKLDTVLSAVDVRLNTAARLIENGSTMIDESAKPDLGLLLNSMLGGNVQSLLGELLNEGQPPRPSQPNDSLPEAARRIADSGKLSTVVLSSFEFDINSGSATVRRRLFHKGQGDRWKLLLSSQETSTTADIKPGQVEAIENDPQVKEVAGLVEGLGLGGGQFSNALQMGAVVQNALAEANQQFESRIQDIITVRNLTDAQAPPLIVLPDAKAP